MKQEESDCNTTPAPHVSCQTTNPSCNIYDQLFLVYLSWNICYHTAPPLCGIRASGYTDGSNDPLRSTCLMQRQLDFMSVLEVFRLGPNVSSALTEHFACWLSVLRENNCWPTPLIICIDGELNLVQQEVLWPFCNPFLTFECLHTSHLYISSVQSQNSILIGSTPFDLSDPTDRMSPIFGTLPQCDNLAQDSRLKLHLHKRGASLRWNVSQNLIKVHLPSSDDHQD